LSTTSPAEWEVVVVGAGPAGAATAARLASAGHGVLLLDREAFPRAKPCGECVSPAGVRALRELGALPSVLQEPHAPLVGWRVHPGAAPPFQGTFPVAEPGLGITRERLDGRLLEHARRSGATVRAPARVADLVRVGGRVAGVRLGGEDEGELLTARLVVGADGLRSVVVRRLGLVRRAPRLRKLALTAHLLGLSDLDDRGELHVFPWGCVGLAPVGAGEANVTVVVPDSESARVAGGRERYFDDVVRGVDRLHRAARAGTVLATGPFDWPVRTAIADGALLVGDAAGYYDPFTGQGIYRALKGAELAARAAEDALRRDDLSAASLAGYERERRRAFVPGQRLQRVIEAFVSRPRLLRLAARRLRSRPELADALVAVTGDLLPVRELARARTLARLALP
jgi:flavin-dependent dehydrogenase